MAAEIGRSKGPGRRRREFPQVRIQDKRNGKRAVWVADGKRFEMAIDDTADPEVARAQLQAAIVSGTWPHWAAR